MANSKQGAVTPMPFPGESPTVALALAAGQKYGLHEEDEKPAKKARPKRAAAKKKAPAKRKSPARSAKKKAPARGTAKKKPRTR